MGHKYLENQLGMPKSTRTKMILLNIVMIIPEAVILFICSFVLLKFYDDPGYVLQSPSRQDKDYKSIKVLISDYEFRI